MPLFLQQPAAFPVTDVSNRCFRWKNATHRQRQLGAEPLPAFVEIGPYGRYIPSGTLATSHLYRLADFYAGTLAEGGVECLTTGEFDQRYE